MKKIGITGGTGFVGQHLTSLLIDKGYEIVIFTTRVAKKPVTKQLTYAHWNPGNGACDINSLKNIDAVVHLAGAGLADKRWTAKRKKEIVDSRVKSTDFLVARLKSYAPRCKTLIATSATGFYGSDNGHNAPFTETSPSSNDFLADTCSKWEAASQQACDFLRLVTLRFGIVLGKESGAFPAFSSPMAFGIMPILGWGRQVVSWIEVDDLARFILFALEHQDLSGTYNAVTPTPVTHRQLINTIADAKWGVRIPVPVPAFLLKAVLGELSNEVLKSCTVSAEKTIKTGFKFDHPDIKSAVNAILGKN
jgi:uncharacterized protein (TIGR01777 family)